MRPGNCVHIKGCSHLRCLFIMLKIQMGPGNCVHTMGFTSQMSFHNVKDTNGTGEKGVHIRCSQRKSSLYMSLVKMSYVYFLSLRDEMLYTISFHIAVKSRSYTSSISDTSRFVQKIDCKGQKV